MSLYIVSAGKKILVNEENVKDPNKFTACLLLFKHKMDNLIEHSFDDNQLFLKARYVAF